MAVTTAREYLPVWVEDPPRAPTPQPLTFVTENGHISIERLAPGDFAFGVDTDQPARLRLNAFAFPGWTLRVDDVEWPLEIAAPQGVMEFTLEPGLHRVDVRFEQTPIRGWATRLSMLALGLLLATPWVAAVLSLVRTRVRWRRPASRQRGAT